MSPNDRFCNWVASPSCAPAFCTSRYATQCQVQCNTLPSSSPDSAFTVTVSTSPPPPPTTFTTAPGSNTACTTTVSGLCFTDGAGQYGNGEHCTITVNRTTTLNVLEFSTEANFDFLVVNGVRYSGTTGPAGVTVQAGAIITWSSDYSVTAGGFTICGTPSAAASNTIGRPGGQLNFFSSSTCTAASAITTVPLVLNEMNSNCQYSPFLPTSLYPITATCAGGGVPPPPPGSCPGTPVCHNNGACNTTSHTCSCGPGYTGPSCSTPVCPYNCSGTTTLPQTLRGTCVAGLNGNQPTCTCNRPYTGSGCQTIQQSIFGVVNTTTTYSGLKNLLSLSPLHATSGFTSFSNILNGMTGNYTLFAPSNSAIASLPTVISTFLASSAGANALLQILEYHVVSNLGPAYIANNSGHYTTLLSQTQLILTETPATAFAVTAATPTDACAVTTYTTGGTTYQCFTEGEGNYGNNERCTINVVSTVTLSLPDGFQTEANFDFLTVNGVRYSGLVGPVGVQVVAGSTITWSSDSSVTFV